MNCAYWSNNTLLSLPNLEGKRLRRPPPATSYTSVWQGVDSIDVVMHIKMSDQWFLTRKMWWSSNGDNRCRVSAARRLDRHQVVQIGRLNSGESFVRDRSLYSETADIWRERVTLKSKAEAASWVNGRLTEWGVMSFGKLFFRPVRRYFVLEEFRVNRLAVI